MGVNFDVDTFMLNALVLGGLLCTSMAVVCGLYKMNKESKQSNYWMYMRVACQGATILALTILLLAR